MRARRSTVVALAIRRHLLAQRETHRHHVHARELACKRGKRRELEVELRLAIRARRRARCDTHDAQRAAHLDLVHVAPDQAVVARLALESAPPSGSLSGGQTPAEASANLDAINRLGTQ